MTNNQHRQVPEALRLANVCSNLTKYSMDAHLIAAELRRQHTRIAELDAQIEALSGVQALSAAPGAFLKSVIALCSHRGYSPANIEAWDKDDKWIADLWRQAESMLAASPTPPAEQQATKETSGGFHVWRDISTAPKDGSRFVATGHNYGLYSEVRHTCVAQWFRGCWMEASDWNETSELKYLTHWMPLPSPPDDVAAPAEQQAAPKAAPGVGNSGFDYKTAADFLSGKTVIVEALREFVHASRRAHDEKTALSATLLAMHGVLTSREAEIALLKKALLEAEAAPKQEVQEPCGWTTGITWRPDTRLQSEQVIKITRDTQPKYGYTTPIYTAPQPAPAPRSDDAERLDWLDQNIFSREMSEWDAKYGHGPDYNMWVVFSPKGVHGSARNIIDAAIAAQGGKDA